MSWHDEFFRVMECYDDLNTLRNEINEKLVNEKQRTVRLQSDFSTTVELLRESTQAIIDKIDENASLRLLDFSLLKEHNDFINNVDGTDVVDKLIAFRAKELELIEGKRVSKLITDITTSAPLDSLFLDFKRCEEALDSFHMSDLRDHLSFMLEQKRYKIQQIYTTQLSNSMETIKWDLRPIVNDELLANSDMYKEFIAGLIKYCEYQTAFRKRYSSFIDPLINRFLYHFMNENMTSDVRCIELFAMDSLSVISSVAKIAQAANCLALFDEFFERYYDAICEKSAVLLNRITDSVVFSATIEHLIDFDIHIAEFVRNNADFLKKEYEMRIISFLSDTRIGKKWVEKEIEIISIKLRAAGFPGTTHLKTIDIPQVIGSAAFDHSYLVGIVLESQMKIVQRRLLYVDVQTVDSFFECLFGLLKEWTIDIGFIETENEGKMRLLWFVLDLFTHYLSCFKSKHLASIVEHFQRKLEMTTLWIEPSLTSLSTSSEEKMLLLRGWCGRMLPVLKPYFYCVENIDEELFRMLTSEN
ncbi:hypothetical protein PCE1_003071 [Barthelona sp. PCE]